jgi:hypothetical protein
LPVVGGGFLRQGVLHRVAVLPRQDVLLQGTCARWYPVTPTAGPVSAGPGCVEGQRGGLHLP